MNQARQTGPHGHAAVVSPDNRFVLAVDLGLDNVFAYRLDPADGGLAPGSLSFRRLRRGRARAIWRSGLTESSSTC